MPPSYLVAWFILFVINQVHRHIWLFGLSCLLSTNFTVIFGCSQYFQKGWTHQCRYIGNNVGLLCCSVLLKVVVASDSGKYQQPTVVDTILVILVNTMLPTNYFNSSAVASYTVIRSDHNKSNMCPRQSLVFWIHPYCWVRNNSIHHISATLPYHGYYTISRLQCHQRSKQNPPKTFPVKENCHTIKSAGVHAFHPHLSFCLKLAHFIPAFHILSSFDPYESPPFDISPGDKRGNPRRCCYVSRPTTQRLQQAASQRSALQQ